MNIQINNKMNLTEDLASNSSLHLNKNLPNYSKAIFNSQVQSSLCQEVDSTLNAGSWDLTAGKYQNKKWKEIFLHMIQSLARQIWFCYNKDPLILKQIQHVQFKQLCLVSFSGNNLSNLQSLTLLNLPNLKHLYLRGNHITQIRCLKKLVTPDLMHLDLTLNRIKEMKFQHIKMNSKQFHNFYFQATFQQPTLNQSLACMARIQANIVQTFTLNSFNRIKENKINLMLQKRFVNSWINICQIETTKF